MSIDTFSIWLLALAGACGVAVGLLIGLRLGRREKKKKSTEPQAELGI